MANGTGGTRNLIGPIAIAAYSYMALVPVIQPPIIRLMTTKKERLIKMKAPRMVNKTEKIMFPIVGLILTTFISPTALPLLGMLFFGNIIKESGVVKSFTPLTRKAIRVGRLALMRPVMTLGSGC